MDDRELLLRLRHDDEHAFATAFRTWYAPLVRLATSMLHDPQVAEEIAQDVLFQLWRRRDQMFEDGSIQAYLFQATRNRVLNHLRHQRVAERGEPQARRELARPGASDEDLIYEEIEGALRRALEELPDRCREAFEMSRVHGLKYAEIADVLGVSVKTVEADMGKALRVLRERLAAWLPEGSSL